MEHDQSPSRIEETHGIEDVMWLCQRLLFAMLFTVVAMPEAGRINAGEAGFDAPRPNALLPIQLKNPTALGVGKLLVAGRGLGDPNFAETVVLLVNYDESGVVGLILNRRTDVPLSRVLDLKEAKKRSDPVYLGGPVGPTAVFALFQSSAKVEKAKSIVDGVYLISDKDLFKQTLSSQPDPGVFHVYVGYCGWTQDQLRAEVQLGAWFIFPADAATVFNSDPDSLWQQMIEKTELKLAKDER